MFAFLKSVYEDIAIRNIPRPPSDRRGEAQLELAERRCSRLRERLSLGILRWLEPSPGAIVARGHGGQNICIIPEEKLVVVLTAEPFSSYEAWIQNEEANRLADLLLEGATPLSP